MQMVTLKNFKSYQSQMVTNINPRINLVIGQNGQGKSNFFKGTLPAIQLFSSL
jgi:chromosome segregation ATPase